MSRDFFGKFLVMSDFFLRQGASECEFVRAGAHVAPDFDVDALLDRYDRTVAHDHMRDSRMVAGEGDLHAETIVTARGVHHHHCGGSRRGSSSGRSPLEYA